MSNLRILQTDQLAWAKALPAKNVWQIRLPDQCLHVNDVSGHFRALRPAGELVVVRLADNRISERPIIIQGEYSEERVLQHFAWVLPELKPVQCMLWRAVNAIRVPVLRQFYLAVLSNDELMQAFYVAKASHHHHHDYPGGLLAHSYEVASSAASLAKQYQLDHLSICISFIAGLLHDIGKIKLYYNEQDGTGVCGQHEAFNFLALAEPLNALQKSAPNIFEALSSALVAKVGYHQPQYLPETIIRLCDRLSAEIAQSRKAFATAPKHYWYVKSPVDGRIFKRLAN